MKSTDPYLTPEQLRSLLAELGEELASRGRRPTADVVGGAAMALAGIRVTRVTQDVDLVVRSGSSDRQELVEAAARVAARRRTADIPGLPDDRVNDRVAAFSDPPDDDPGAQDVVTAGLHLRIASPRRLLAMKLAAGRLKDREDTLALLHVTGIRTRTEIESLLRETFDDRVDAGPPEGVDLSDTLLFADGFLRLVADRPGPEAV